MTARGRKLPGIAAGALALALPIALAACNNQNSYRPPPPQQVKVQAPIHRKITLYAQFTGTTVAVNQVDLVARVQGFLQTVGFKDGDQVKKDQILFGIEKLRLYQTSLDTLAKAGVAQQQALLTSRRIPTSPYPTDHAR